VKFKQNIKDFLSSKTNWTGIGMIAGGAGGFYFGQMDFNAAAQLVASGFALIFVRDAIAGMKQQ